MLQTLDVLLPVGLSLSVLSLSLNFPHLQISSSLPQLPRLLRHSLTSRRQ